MKTNNYKLKKCLLLLSLAGFGVQAQNVNHQQIPLCRTSEAMTEFYQSHPEAQNEKAETEAFTQQYVQQVQNSVQKIISADATQATTYTIPVVFHVYGTTQGGYSVTLAKIQAALVNLNKDFQGLNSDYNTVHSQFQSVRGTLSITFALALKDPSGATTTGMVTHAVKSGYGNGSGYDSQIAADAWDNYKYMNVYIMNDLYANGVTNNSGVSWYPSTTMSNAKTARVVYNGAYLGTNTSTEFASVLTHEFGHWLNLIHTFEGGCVAPNDNVADTPPCDYNGVGYSCHPTSTSNSPLNCTSVLINAENYMDYSGADGCYKMYTQGQITRMTAALQVPSRVTLWQTSNLIATGLLSNVGIATTTTNTLSASVFPNPSTGIFKLEMNSNEQDNYKIVVTDILGNIVSSMQTGAIKGYYSSTIDLTEKAQGLYFVSVISPSANQVMKLVKE